MGCGQQSEPTRPTAKGPASTIPIAQARADCIAVHGAATSTAAVPNRNSSAEDALSIAAPAKQGKWVLDHLPMDSRRCVELRGHWLQLFNTTAGAFARDANCFHRGASLEDADIESLGDRLMIVTASQ